MHRERPHHSRALLPHGRPLCCAPTDITERQKLPSPPSLASPTHCPPLALPHANAENSHGRRELEFGRCRSPTSERFAAQQPPPLSSPCLAPSRVHARPSHRSPYRRRHRRTAAAAAAGRRRAWPGRVGPPRSKLRPPTGARGPTGAPPPLSRRRHGLLRPEQRSPAILCSKFASGTSRDNSTK